VKLGWRGALGIALSAACLWWALHNVTWRQFADGVAHANPWLLLASSAAATGIFPLRARRWRTILDPVAPNLPFGPLWRSTAIGMMGNNVLPARAGEVARAFALSREVPAVNFSTAFASLAVDRLFDAVALFGLMFAAMLDPAFPRGATIGDKSIGAYALGGLSLLAGLLVVLYLLALFPGRVIALYEAFARRVAPGIEAKGRAVLTSFASGLSVLRSPGRFAAVLWWALLHWLLNGFAFWLAFRAVHLEASFAAALFVQGVIAVGVAAPSTPGFVGVWELTATIGLAVYGIPASSALIWAICFHTVSYIPITLIGLAYFSRLGLKFDEVANAGAPDAAASP
jgi:glycosyltransferase 2 family protein